MDLRKEAEGRECQIRIAGCSYNRDTVVLAHSNNKGMFGVGISQKAPDMFGAWSCNHCHDIVDGKLGIPVNWTKDEVDLAFAHGIFRTQNILLQEEKINF